MLPLDLHVLSLPLAFILSQDQTLHCIISYKSQFEPWLSLILCGTPDEESPGIDALVLIVFFRYLLLYTFRTPRLASFIWDSEVSSSQSFQ